MSVTMPDIDTLDRLVIEADRDYVHEFHGYWTPGGICRVRIFERTGMIPVLILTELPNNTNTSVTNLIENLAAEVVLDNEDVLAWGPEYTGGNPPFALIEHYPDRFPSSTFRDSMFAESFDYVTFPNYEIHYEHSFALRMERPRFKKPEWGRLERNKFLEIVLRTKGGE